LANITNAEPDLKGATRNSREESKAVLRSSLPSAAKPESSIPYRPTEDLGEPEQLAGPTGEELAKMEREEEVRRAQGEVEYIASLFNREESPGGASSHLSMDEIPCTHPKDRDDPVCPLELTHSWPDLPDISDWLLFSFSGTLD
jgi:hypothetical protein